MKYMASNFLHNDLQIQKMTPFPQQFSSICRLSSIAIPKYPERRLERKWSQHFLIKNELTKIYH